MHDSIITPEAQLRCATHTLADQLAQLREIERQRVIAESCERILRDADELLEVKHDTHEGGQ